MVFVNEIPIKNIINQYFFYPITVGQDRGDLLNFDLKNTIFQFKYLYFAIIPYLFIFSELELISGKYILLGCFDDCQKTSIGIPPLGAKKP